MALSTESELGKALKNGDETLEIEGDLAKKVLRIKATGKVAWVVAIGALGVAVVAVISTGGTAAPVASVGIAPAIAVLGIPSATSAVLIAVAAGGVGVLNSLRKYKIVDKSENKVVLVKK